jgi:aminopeptidase N
MKCALSLVFLTSFLVAKATDPYPKNDAIDIKHYTFQLEVNDSTNNISGQATVRILFKSKVTDFELDLAGRNGGAEGMEVMKVMLGDKPLRFSHKNDRLKISLGTLALASEELTIQIIYHGIPKDGLIIGRNKFGDRGFFGDNWPDRGHQWLPVVDHPSDKAGVDFIVIAPLYYSVVANGILVEESPIDTKRKLTHWQEDIDIPVKVMVVGIARFAVQYVGKVDDISVQTWVYPQNRVEGFYDYAVAVKILDYFHHHIGSYHYKKLANVQSKTRWGGLENANTIFYAENLLNGKGEQELIVAHEEAHQWFGNSATEKDWHHVWLSEGFATYFSHLYLEYAYGHDRLVEAQKNDRVQVIRYFSQNPAPIVDTTVLDINRILNINAYQKGGWVLHMLRRKVGDLAFWKGIQQYYANYHDGNVLTGDFQRAMEDASGLDLTAFFDQWLWRGGHPKLAGAWTYDPKSKSVTVTINQVQAGPPFSVPLDIGVRLNAESMQITTVNLDGKSQKFSIAAENRPTELTLDPNTWLLFEGQVNAK